MAAGSDVTSAKKPGASLADPSSGVAINRMPGLNALMTQAASSLGAALEPLLGTAPKCRFDGLGPTTVGKYILESRHELGLGLVCAELDAQVLLAFDRRTPDFLLAVIFGEKLDDAPAQQATRPVTPIGRRLAGEFAITTARVFASAFLSASPHAFSPRNALAISDIETMGWRDMPAVEARFLLDVRPMPCAFKLLVPQTVLHVLHEALTQEAPARAAPSDPHWSQQITEGVTRAPVAVHAILEETEMTLGELASLKVGDLVDLRGGTLGRVRLECEGRGVFWGRLNQSDGRYQIAVENLIDDDEEPGARRGPA